MDKTDEYFKKNNPGGKKWSSSTDQANYHLEVNRI